MGIRISAGTLSKAAEKAGVPDLFDVSRPGDGTTYYVVSTTRETLSSKRKQDMSRLVGMITGYALSGSNSVDDIDAGMGLVDAGLAREADRRDSDAFASGFKFGYESVR